MAADSIHRDLSTYTKTEADDHEIAKRLIADILQNEAKGKYDEDGGDNTISSTDLAERVTAELPAGKHIGASAIRDLIPKVRIQYGVPIGSIVGKGYFVITSQAEARIQIDRQIRQAETSRQRARDIAAVWYQQESGDE